VKASEPVDAAAAAVVLARAPLSAGEQMRVLFGLRWRLLWRGLRGSTSALVTILAVLVFFAPFALGGAFLLGFGFELLGAPNNEHLLRATLLAIYVFWVVTPLLGYALNDTHDISRLFVYPISLRRIFTGAILGSVIDVTTLLLLPTLIAAIVTFTNDPLAFVPVAALVALFLFHTLALSQALILASAGVLRSRRFRDIVLVILPVFWMSWYVGSQMLSRRAVSVDWKRSCAATPGTCSVSCRRAWPRGAWPPPAAVTTGRRSATSPCWPPSPGQPSRQPRGWCAWRMKATTYGCSKSRPHRRATPKPQTSAAAPGTAPGRPTL
jgi:hypothetical protein